MRVLRSAAYRPVLIPVVVAGLFLPPTGLGEARPRGDLGSFPVAQALVTNQTSGSPSTPAPSITSFKRSLAPNAFAASMLSKWW